MRCTNCGQVIRPVVAVDIDGVLGMYHTQFVQFAEWYVGYPLPSVYQYMGDVEFSEYLGLDKAEYRQIKLAYRQGAIKRFMPKYTGATAFMNDLEDLDVEVWIASTRPWDRLDNIDPDTRHWLDRNKMPYDHLLYGDDKYEQLAQQVDPDRVIAVVEDLLPLCLAAERLFGEVVWQPVHEHTERMPYARRFNRWDEVLVDVEVKSRRWRVNDEGATAR